MILNFKYEIIAIDAPAETVLLYANWYGLKCLMLEQFSGVKIAVSSNWLNESLEFYALDENFNTDRLQYVADDNQLSAAFDNGDVKGCYLGGYIERGNWFATDDIPNRLEGLVGQELLDYLMVANEKARFQVWPAKNDYYSWVNKVELEDRKKLRYKINAGSEVSLVSEPPEGNDFGVEIMSLLRDTVKETVPKGIVSVDRSIGSSATISSEAYQAGIALVDTLENYNDIHFLKAGVSEDDIIFSQGRPFASFGNLKWLRSFSAEKEVAKSEPVFLSLLMNMVPLPEWVNVVVVVSRVEEENTTVVPATYEASTYELTYEWDEELEEYVEISTEIPGALITPEKIVFDPLFFVISGNETALKQTDVVTINAGYESLGLEQYDSAANPIYKWCVFLTGEDGRRVSPIEEIYLDRAIAEDNCTDIVWLNGLGGWNNLRASIISDIPAFDAVYHEEHLDDDSDTVTVRKAVTATSAVTVSISLENIHHDSLNDLIHSDRLFFYDAGSLTSVSMASRISMDVKKTAEKMERRELTFIKSKRNYSYGLE